MITIRNSASVLSLALLFLWACAPGGGDPDMVILLLPQGDIEAGKTAFIDLQCSSCHKISGVKGLPEPVTS